ncbi:ATP synthase F1 subunit gamma [Patescibacteria group bacterium]|nr:ATP synthase F1 subunit gamma [Patescibacteria group bacterium]
MPSGTRDLRRRIKAIGNTKKITKAMQMVAASKMRKAIASVLATRDYANLAWTTILHLSEKTDPNLHPLLQKKEKVERVGLILITSNRGLCGGFNMQVVNKAISSIKKHELTVKQTEILTLGKRGRDIIHNFGYSIMADFPKQDITLNTADVSSLSRLVLQDFVGKKYDKVFIAFTDFVSTLSQIPRVRQLLPMTAEPDEYIGVVGKSAGIETTKEFIEEKKEKYLTRGDFTYEYTFEPSADKVLEEMLPRLIEMQIYQAVLESEASEHSARMVAMKKACDAAGDMIDDLTLYYNRARQAGITQEITEISSGAASLSSK